MADAGDRAARPGLPLAGRGQRRQARAAPSPRTAAVDIVRKTKAA